LFAPRLVSIARVLGRHVGQHPFFGVAQRR
jgi:hypothetical protein